MKKTLAFLSLAATISIFAFTAKKEEKYIVDTEKSSIEWVGKKVTGQHTGTIKLKEGALVYNGNSLKGGSFVIDMTTIAATDGAGDRLVGHLKADDFFGVEKFPTTSFAVTKVTASGKDQVNVTGNLTIKGITQPINFPATVKKQGNSVVAVAKGVKVDRSKYGIKYGSKSFFEGLGDKMIYDDFELSINLLAKK